MAKWLKITLGVIFSILIVGSTGMALFYYTVNKSLPDYEGTKELTNLNSRIEIYRDSNAVPYIFAETSRDAAFALGYVHAQERMFQMDMLRRAAEGRLSEIFGGVTLPYDRMFLSIGILRTVQRDVSKLPPQIYDQLKAYSDGVNSYIQEKKGSLPIEFDVMAYEPYLWKPEHSMMIAKLMAWQLNLSWWTDITFTMLVQKLGEEKARGIIPDYPENAPLIIPYGLSSYPFVSDDIVKTDLSFREFMGFSGTHIGSNNWAVSPVKSVSGKPIIANDPHLSLETPGKWYFAAIKTNDLQAEGFTLPGTPGIVIGKNQSISWTMTNIMTDDCDFYIEHLDSAKKKYLVNGEWRDLKSYRYNISVKDSESVELNVKETHRGPIIDQIHPYNRLYPIDDTLADISMRWMGNESTEEIEAAYLINRAQNWEEFKKGVSHFSAPGQNFVYADKDGNIGYVCGTKLPVRSSNSTSFVFDGSTDAYDWRGFVPFESMPQLFNPANNFIATANNKVVSGFQYHISNLWEPPSRIQRITSLLSSKAKISTNDFKSIQMDQVSPFAEQLTGYITSAFVEHESKSKNVSRAVELLSRWDFSMDQYSQVPAIFCVFFQYMMRNTFLDEMGENLFNRYIFLANIPYRSLPDLMETDSSSWFDDVRSKRREHRNEIIRKSVYEAVKFIESQLGTDISQWQWGKLHKITFKHMFSGRLPALDKLINIGPYEVGGDGTTVFNTEYSFNKPYANYLGPSMRYIYDFGKPEEINLILSTGQSGNIFSEHYSDMTEKWLTGKYIKINTSERIIKNSGYKLLILR